MNGIKWSQIEPDCDPESDRVLSVKPANAPGNSKKGKNRIFWPKLTIYDSQIISVNNFIQEQPHFNQNQLTQLVWQAQVCVPNTGMTPFPNSPIQSLVQANTGTAVGIPNNIPLQNAFQQAAPVQAQYAQPIQTNIPVALNEHQVNNHFLPTPELNLTWFDLFSSTVFKVQMITIKILATCFKSSRPKMDIALIKTNFRLKFRAFPAKFLAQSRMDHPILE